MIAGNLLGGSAGDRFGMRRTAIVALTVSALCCLSLPWLPSAVLAVVSGIGGFAGGATRPVLSGVVAGQLPPERRREGVALSRTAMNAGAILGPPVGALLSSHAFGLVFVVDGATTLLLVAVIVRFVPVGEQVSRVVVGSLPQALVRDRALRRLVVGIVCVDTVYRLMYTVLPLQLRDSGVPTLGYAVLLSLNSVVIVLAEAPLALRFRDRPAVGVIATGFVLVGAGFAVLGTLALGLPLPLVAATVMMLVVTVGEMLYKPTATAYAADLAPDGMVGRYQSAYSAASISGTLLSPVIGGAVYAVAPVAVWPLACLLALVGAWHLLGHAPWRRGSERAFPVTRSGQA